MQKKILFLFSSVAILLFGILVLLLCPVYPTGNVLAKNLGNYGNDINYTDIVDNVKTATWIIFTIIVVVCFVLAGILFLTAQGAPDKINTAKSAFIWGIVGVVVGIIAFTIVTLVTTFLTPSSGSDTQQGPGPTSFLYQSKI